MNSGIGTLPYFLFQFYAGYGCKDGRANPVSFSLGNSCSECSRVSKTLRNTQPHQGKSVLNFENK